MLILSMYIKEEISKLESNNKYIRAYFTLFIRLDTVNV